MTAVSSELSPPRENVRRASLVAMAAVAALAVAGGALGMRTLVSGTSEPVSAAAPTPVAAADHAGVHRVTEQVPTSFGRLAVPFVDRSSGVESSALGGSTHFPSYVGAEKMQVQVALDIRNTLPQAHEVRADQFTLLAGKERYQAGGATSPSYPIQPNAALGFTLSYTVPRNGTRMTLLFTEAPGAAPVKIDLGRATARVERSTGVTPPVTPDSHDDHSSTPSTTGKR